MVAYLAEVNRGATPLEAVRKGAKRPATVSARDEQPVVAKRVRESEGGPLLAVAKSPARSTPPENPIQVLLGLLSRCIIDDRLVNAG